MDAAPAYKGKQPFDGKAHGVSFSEVGEDNKHLYFPIAKENLLHSLPLKKHFR